MLIWKGNGIAVPLIVAGSLLGLDYVTGQANGPGYYATHVWPKLVAFGIAAVATFFVARANDNAGREDDHFFFVPLRYWTVILVIGGIILSIVTTESSAASAPSTETAKQETAQPQPAASTPPPVPAPVTDSTAAATIPQKSVAPPPAPEAEQKKFAQVYIDSQTKTYFPETCSGRPATAIRVAKSVAMVEGYTLSPTCK